MKPQNNGAWLYLVPALAILGFAGVVPLVAVFNYSFFDIFTLDSAFWIGGEWYREILSSERFYASLGRSLLFSLIVLSVQMPLGVGIALLLRRSGRVSVFVLMLLAVPLVVPWNMIPTMWLSLINTENGLLGMALAKLGIGFDYKFNAVHTWIVLVAMDTWHWTGLVAVLAYAGLSGIPPAYYRAAAIDGASRYQVFRYIELPKIADVMFMALLLRFMDSFMIYIEAFRINAGGPDNATTFLSLDLGEAINGFSYGSAAAHSVIYFLMVLTIAWAFRTAMDRRGRASSEAIA
ncbi:sugar ABC transporter permease [Pseudohoeflea suaedae]|uniref:Sugar ABC transporter permease n=1 Tax=Pseudohoeflea suaedae TaxID=877384 RepID=A0A4R5PJZ2_9HYPH|nr:sugar ABC transporter permease [Pseudohoeflea suaedae]TDH35905.1 sugar ABC transporter permease [Pseudohoeflea suaedae]